MSPAQEYIIFFHMSTYNSKKNRKKVCMYPLIWLKYSYNRNIFLFSTQKIIVINVQDYNFTFLF